MSGGGPNVGGVVVFWDYDTQWAADRSRQPGGPKEWGKLEFETTERVLELHRQFEIPACFAVVGMVAKEGARPYHDPAQVRRIFELGHEIASHSMRHDWPPALGRRALLEDLRTSKDALEQCIGAKVVSYVPPFNRPYDFVRKLAFSVAERREVKSDRVDLPVLCEALRETGYEFCRVSYWPMWERVPDLMLFRRQRTWRPSRVEWINSVRCLRVNNPGGFGQATVDVLKACAGEGGIAVAFSHPHDLGVDARTESSLARFLERVASLVKEKRIRVVLPRDLLTATPVRTGELCAASGVER